MRGERTARAVGFATVILVSSSSEARAQAPDAVPPPMPAYAGLGPLLGGATAASLGYLVLQRDGWNDGDGTSLAWATGVGLLSGTALALTVGVADRSIGDRSRPPYYGFNALLVASAFTVSGAVIGAAYFAADALAKAPMNGEQGQPVHGQDLAVDTATGALVGLGAAVVLEGVGAIAWGGRATQAPTVALGVTPARSGRGAPTVFIPTLVGRY